ncbi:MAG: hypothetical protein R3F53_02085 [Gammaproteobacteria bacterium]
MRVPTKVLTGLLSVVIVTGLSACSLVSESLLVKNKASLQKPQTNPVPAEMKGSYMVSTPQGMTNRFSYYGLAHAEKTPD